MDNHTSSTNCTVDVLQGVGYSPVFLLGFFVNVVALRAFFAKRDSWTDTHIYMLNLVVADSTLVLFLPFRIYDAFFCIPKTVLCTFLMYVHFLNMYASIWTTAAISVQRYLAVRFPLQARTWKRKKETAFAVCFLLWGLLVTLCVVYRAENYPDNLWTCYERRKDLPLIWKFMLLILILGFCTPLLIVVFCSGRVICVLSKADGETKGKNMRNMRNMVTANMIVFIICYTPIHVAFLTNYYNDVSKINWKTTPLPAHRYLLVSEWIAATNCCLDSFSYYFLLKGFILK